jgi:tetratricopeptide (TPR) repeat protein
MTDGLPTDIPPRERKAASLYLNFVQKPWLLALMLVIITVAVYQPTWRAGFVWDDDALVTRNLTERSLAGLERIWFKPGATLQYYPLVFTSFWVEYHLWNLRPLGYHLINVLLHASNAILLWLILRKLKVPGSWWAAAVFALHPVCVESVAWITERKNVLSGLFYFLTVLAYLRFRPLDDREGSCVCHWRHYPLVLVLFLCALLSKTVTSSLPAALLLLIWWKTGRVQKRDIVGLVPLFVLGVAAGLMTAWLEKHHVGASGPEWSLSLLQRCLLAGRAWWFYAGKLFWPHPLTFIYPHWEIDPKAWWQYLFPTAALALLVALWSLRSRIGRGPLVAVLYFTAALAPALGFFDVYPFRFSFVADHFQYLACSGLIALAVSTGAAIWERAGPWGRHWGTVTTTIVLLILGVLTWRQARIYQDLETLWRDTLAKNPNCWLAHNNLGGLLTDEGKLEEAIWHCQQALRLMPDYVEAHNNLGNALMKQDRLSEAIDQFEQALRLTPDFAEVHCNLAAALQRAGEVQQAIQHWEEALRINPDLAEAHYNLGVALVREGRLPEAMGHYEQALRARHDFFELGSDADIHNKLGLVLIQLGRLPEAIGQFEQAVQTKPDYAEAHANLANALTGLGRLPEAIGQYEQALRVKPDFVGAHYNLGLVLEKLGRTQEAIEHYEQAVRINPDFVPARTALARARAGQ